MSRLERNTQTLLCIKSYREVINVISVWNYGNYSSDNYGSCRAVSIGDITLYFSYDTIVAFRIGGKLVISENAWSNTTGKHLNFINPNKEIRIPYGEFKRKLELLEKTIEEVTSNIKDKILIEAI